MTEQLETTQPLLCNTDEQLSYNGEVRNSSVRSEEEPVSQIPPALDKYNAAYCIFFLQGVGMLLPWNFFSTAKAYFVFKVRTDPSIGRNVENAFSVASMVPNCLSLFINVFLTKRIKRDVRVYSSLILVLISFMVTTALVEIDTSHWPDLFFAITIVTVVIVNLACGITQGSLFGLGGMLGPRYIQAIMGGQGIAGIFAALASILSLLVGKDVKSSGFAYFLSAVVVLSACVVAYFVLLRLNFIKAYLNRTDYLTREESMQQPVNTISTDSGEYNPDVQMTGTPYWSIFTKVSRMAFSVCFVFFVTLSLYPAVCSDVQSMHYGDGSKWATTFFVPVTCFLLFNVCDFLGRALSGFVQFPGHRGPWLPALCFSRAVFIPLFALCNTRNRQNISTVVFTNDAFPISFMVLFGLSNGYLGSLCMMYGPRFADAEHAEVAGNIMVFFLTLGLSMGAGFSFILNNLI